ncbi:MAG TPA: flavin reductase family protein [Candidatus Thermoplasmatota archaeon]|nr:flavin reductase family protein [Candidatus Thermoplasmatota archaeon]
MDEAAKKQALRLIPYGLYVIGCRSADGHPNAFLGSWVSQTSFKPPLVMIGVRAGSQSNGYIRETKRFSVSQFGADQKALATKFLKDVVLEGRAMNGVPFEEGELGLPYFPDTVADFACRLVETVDVGDHTIFVGEVVEARYRGGAAARALTHAETGWHYGG